jgi:hypothetical protein
MNTCKTVGKHRCSKFKARSLHDKKKTKKSAENNCSSCHGPLFSVCFFFKHELLLLFMRDTWAPKGFGMKDLSPEIHLPTFHIVVLLFFFLVADFDSSKSLLKHTPQPPPTHSFWHIISLL